MFLRNCWYMVGWSTELGPGALHVREVIGEDIVLFRSDDSTLHALIDRCPHRAAPLSCGRLEGPGLRCMYHGLHFDADGRCLEIPGQPTIPRGMGARGLPVAEVSGWAFVWMGEPDAADHSLLPAVVGPEHPEWEVGCGVMDYDANYQLISDNLCDFSHLGFVHINSFGGGDEASSRIWARTQPHIESLHRGIRVSRWQRDVPSGRLRHELGTDRVDRLQSYDYLAPGVLLMRVDTYPVGTAPREPAHQGTGPAPVAPCGVAPLHANFTAQSLTPLDANRTRYHFSWGPGRAERRGHLTPLMVALAEAAFSEDKAMIEAQQRVLRRHPDAVMRPIVHDRGPNLMRAVMQRLMREETAVEPVG